MIGQTVSSIEKRTSAVFLLLVIAGVVCLIAMLSGTLHVMVIAAAFVLTFFLVNNSIGRHFEAEIREDGLFLTETEVLVPYDSIQAIEFNPDYLGRGRPSSIILSRSQNSIDIPAGVSCGDEELFAFLAGEVSLQRDSPLPEKLNQYYSEQLSRYGDKSVLKISARDNPAKIPRNAATAAFAKSMWLSVPIFVGAMFFDALYIVGVVTAAVLGLVLWGTSKERTKPTNVAKRFNSSAIVLSPEGLAMQQGDVSGQIAWGRVQSVEMLPPAKDRFAATGKMIGVIGLRVGSSRIMVYDVYCQPLFLLYQLMDAARNNAVLPPPAEDVEIDVDEPLDDSPYRAPRF